MANLQEEMARVKSSIDSLILEEILPSSSPVKEVELLYRMMRDYPSRPAKGLRPFICVTACRAMGGREGDALLTAACVELFQHWVLVHDDIEDGSELRRGEPTLHKKYGDGLALNAGDALHARMWGALLENERALGTARTIRILEEFSRMVDETTEGQAIELAWVRDGRWDLEESDYEEMCMRKTSWYTIASPCRLGAIVAGAEEGDLERLREFGMKLGVGFQIQDDTLNLVGDPLRYGKASTDDILEGKRTLMLIRVFGSASEEERARLVQTMAKRREEKTGAEVEYVLSLIKKYGAVEYAQRKARALVDDALSVLPTIGWRDEASVETLRAVAKFAVDRQW